MESLFHALPTEDWILRHILLLTSTTSKKNVVKTTFLEKNGISIRAFFLTTTPLHLINFLCTGIYKKYLN